MIRSDGSYLDLFGPIIATIIVACAIALWSSTRPSAQTGGTVTITGRDAKTGQPVTTVGNVSDQSIRTHVVGTDPPLVTPATRVVGPLGNPLQVALASGNAVNVNVVAQRTPDPCIGMKANAAISQTGNAKIVSAYPGHRLVICSIVLVGADAENISLVEGTGTTCGTGTAAVIGGATAANGPNLAANGGFVVGNGQGAIAVQASQADDLCLFQSGAGRVAGSLTYAFTP